MKNYRIGETDMTNEQQRAAFEAQIELPPLPIVDGATFVLGYEADDAKLHAWGQACAQAGITHFLETTGQYVANDASRQAAIDEAIAKDRQQQYRPVYEEGWKDALEWRDRQSRGEPSEEGFRWRTKGYSIWHYVWDRDPGEWELQNAEIETVQVFQHATPQPAEPIKQYFYKANGCQACGAKDDSCICWHDQGTGVFSDIKPGDSRHGVTFSWRDKPAEPVKLNRQTQDQIAAVMLQTGTPEQQAEALRYCGIEPVKGPSDDDIRSVWLEVYNQAARSNEGHRHAFARVLLARYGNAAQPAAHGNAEDMHAAHEATACPFCGGSGHKDDVQSAVSVEPVPDGTLDRLYIGKATSGDQLLAWQALRAAPVAAQPSVSDLIERLAGIWDGCEYEDVGTSVDIGAAIRRDAARMVDPTPSANGQAIDYEALYGQMCERCDSLDKELAKYTEADGQAQQDATAMARRFHDEYERLAPSFGYETRSDTRTFDPESPNGRLMIAVCGAIQAQPCGICFETEPHTGTCGSSDPKALCNQSDPVLADRIAWQANGTGVERTAVMVDGRRWYRDDDPKVVGKHDPAMAGDWEKTLRILVDDYRESTTRVQRMDAFNQLRDYVSKHVQPASGDDARDAGLEEAATLCERNGALYTGLDMAGQIRTLKSDAKEASNG